MDSVMKCEKALLDALRSSEAFKRYDEAKQQLDEHPEKWEVVNAYRSSGHRLAMGGATDGQWEQMEWLQKDHHEVTKDVLVAEYLEAEVAVCRMMQEIYLDLAQLVDLRLEELDCL